MRCIDNNIGNMLHAYELRTLTDDEREVFEVHLLKCEFCSQALQEFKAHVAAIREDEEFQKMAAAEATLRKTSRQSTDSLNPMGRFLHILLRKSAFIGLIIVLLIIPIAIITVNKQKSPPVQIINLAPIRSQTDYSFVKSKGISGQINFIIPGNSIDASLTVSIIDSKGNTIIFDSDFSSFDNRNRGVLSLALDSLSTGTYSLIVKGYADSVVTTIVEYSFRVKD